MVSVSDFLRTHYQAIRFEHKKAPPEARAWEKRGQIASGGRRNAFPHSLRFRLALRIQSHEPGGRPYHWCRAAVLPAPAASAAAQPPCEVDLRQHRKPHHSEPPSHFVL